MLMDRHMCVILVKGYVRRMSTALALGAHAVLHVTGHGRRRHGRAAQALLVTRRQAALQAMTAALLAVRCLAWACMYQRYAKQTAAAGHIQ